jgi:uncharacterized membrane protein YagU involved in acid resistance
MSNSLSMFPKPIAGALSGFLATVPMTVAMIAINKLMDRPHREQLEPRKITDDVLNRVGVRDELDEEGRKQAAIAAHFAFGSAAGSLYPVVEPYISAPPALRGPIYGLGVWAVSYCGVLPAIDSLPSPEKRPLGRTVLLVAAHLVWGAALDASMKVARRVSHS